MRIMPISWLPWSVSLALLSLLAVGCRQKDASSEPFAALVAAMNRGVSEMGQYNYDGAAKAFEEALRLDPSLVDAKVNLAIARFNRAQKEQQDVERSLALLDAVLQSEPNQVRAWYFKGIVLQHQGQAEAAVSCFEKVVQQRPNDGVAWYILGLCKQRAGHDCQAELRRAIELRPYLASAHYRLWQTLQAAGKSAEAAPYLEKFKQLRESPLAETIELPQYNQMGDLALAQPVAARVVPPITRSAFSVQPAQVLYSSNEAVLASATPSALGGIAAGDLNGDGAADLVFTSTTPDGPSRLVLLRGGAQGGYADVTASSGLDRVADARACAMGDIDNDGVLDLVVAGTASVHLLRGKGDGTFADVTSAARVTANGPIGSITLLDADHDGDLDIALCGEGLGLQLWNNNADGTFADLSAKLALADQRSAVAVLPGDLDGDRDMDLVLLRVGQPAVVLENELLGRFRPLDTDAAMRADLGGVLQDFNGDHQLDLLALGGEPAALRLFLGDGHGHFHEDTAFGTSAKAMAAGSALRGVRAVDLDLDGDLDVVAFGDAPQTLLNDGRGKFVAQLGLWPMAGEGKLTAAEVLDLDGDLVPDLLRAESGRPNRLVLARSVLTPPSTGFAVAPTGMRGRDKRTRSPATGFGTSLVLRSGLHEQRLVHTGLSGGPNQSALPIVFGLGGARQADYLQLLWTDGVAQVEIALPAAQTHRVAELQRKISSCPVLFTWNGSRFEFVTDFAGVGGLGYFVGGGEYAQPQPLEHVRIAPEQLQARDGAYELRITEPMEETAYVDRLELLAIDHPADWQVFPDERLVVTGPAATHELLAVDRPIFARAAFDPTGRDCTDALARVDRVYAYQPELDRRFCGFCAPHTLELDFADRLATIRAGERVYLFLTGFLEYPFSQTGYAAGQANVAWEPIRIERQTPDGQWQPIVPDAGAFGGMARTMTVDLTDLVSGPTCRLRLTSNLEIFYDQLFVARAASHERLQVHALPVSGAELRRVGFAREFSPDGRLPLIYDYDLTDATAPFHVLRGAYTRYGAVEELLREFDDRYVLVGPGDEIAAKFDARALPPVRADQRRTFILVSHAYCKDMDLYTAAPQTLAPLPFRGMSRYPYPDSEHFPDSAEHRDTDARYNTRIVD